MSKHTETICSSFIGNLFVQIIIQRKRLRESIHRVSGRQPRPSPIYRRTYSVAGPNALWHLDGNHKLVRWKFVVHGAIDGYSRLITFLQCSTNNWSETVLKYFIKGTQECGIPSRVRTDHGGENIRVWEFMEEQRGTERGSYIASRSVHNSRIERLWRDVYRSVSSSYSAIFTELECDGVLNTDNESDMYALHYVFLPRINASLSGFKLAWNNHSLSTENNMSPLQLYTAYSQGSCLFDETIDPLTYGVDPADNEDSVTAEDEESVVVPQINIPLTHASLQQLHVINPLEECGKQLYIDTVHLLFNLMISDGLID